MLRMRNVRDMMSIFGIKTQTELAKILGMDRSRLNSIVNNRIDGRLNLATVDKFCAVFECEPGDILERVPEEPLKKECDETLTDPESVV